LGLCDAACFYQESFSLTVIGNLFYVAAASALSIVSVLSQFLTIAWTSNRGGQSMATSERLSIVSLTHDLVMRRSIALITWDDVADRRLAVAVPFNTKLEDLLPAVQAALVELRTELEIADLKIAAPPQT
jgi:hypothetical protein